MKDSPAQSPEAGEEGEESELGDSGSGPGGEADSEPTPAPGAQIETISSGTERKYSHKLH